jgi:hypothetical protein
MDQNLSMDTVNRARVALAGALAATVGGMPAALADAARMAREIVARGYAAKFSGELREAVEAEIREARFAAWRHCYVEMTDVQIARLARAGAVAWASEVYKARPPVAERAAREPLSLTPAQSERAVRVLAEELTKHLELPSSPAGFNVAEEFARNCAQTILTLESLGDEKPVAETISELLEGRRAAWPRSAFARLSAVQIATIGVFGAVAWARAVQEAKAA